jgi:hypothetical protein
MHKPGIWVPNIEIILRRDGEVLDVVKAQNAKTTNFINAIVDQLLAAPTLAKPQYMAVGTGAPAANALGAESARVALSSKTRAGAVLTMSADFPPGTATAALTEAGIFDATPTGNMHFSGTFAAVNKDANMDLVINWTYTQT